MVTSGVVLKNLTTLFLSTMLILIVSGDVGEPLLFTTVAVIRFVWLTNIWFEAAAIRASMVLDASVLIVAPVTGDTVMFSPDVEFRNP